MFQGQLKQVAGEARDVASASILPKFSQYLASFCPGPQIQGKAQKRGLGTSGLGT